jgi:integrase
VAAVIHYGGQPVRDVGRAWERARAIAGLGADVVPHTLRHTAATWLMQAGRDRYEVAGFLGMSLATLEDVYGHHHPDFQGGIAATRLGAAHDTPSKPPSNVVKLRPPPPPNALKRRG